MNPTTARRIAALERSPRLSGYECMPLDDLLEEVARLLAEHDPTAAQRLRECEPSKALECACDMLGRYIGQASVERDE